MDYGFDSLLLTVKISIFCENRLVSSCCKRKYSMSSQKSSTVTQNKIINISETHKKTSSLLAWSILSCAWLFYIYEYVLRVSPGVIEKLLMIDFQTTATLVGTISGAYYWSYVPLQVPCGIIADKLGARRVILISSILCVIGCLLFAIGSSITAAIIARIMMGAGSACAYICCSKVAAEWFSKDRFAILAGTTMFMGTLGGSFNTLFASLVDLVSWRTAFFICAAIGVGLCVIVWTIMKDSPTGNTKVQLLTKKSSDSPKLLDGLKIVSKNPQNWLIGLYGCAMYLPLCAFAELWGVSYLTQIYNIAPKIASRACIGVFIGMGIGSIVSAFISNMIKSRVKVMSWAAIGTLISFFIVFFIPNIPFYLMCTLLFIGGLLSGGQTLYFTVAKEHTPIQYSATAIGFINALVMCSAIVFQPLLGKILDMTWHGELTAEGARIYSVSNYQTAFIAVAIAFVIGWILMLFVKETYTVEENKIN